MRTKKIKEERMRKSVILILVLLSVGGVLFGRGTQETGEEVPELAVLLPGSVEFFSVMQDGMNRAAEDFGVDLTYADAGWDPGLQLSQVENYVTRGVDMILLCAGDNQALLSAVDICQEAGIPLITFTNTIGDRADGFVPGIVTFIGTNEVSLGRMLGEMGEELLAGEAAKVVLIEGAPGTAPQRLRTQGFMEIFDTHDDWELVYSQAIPGWTKEGALGAMEAFLQTGQEVNLVVTHWNAAAAAAAMAIEEAGYPEKVYIVGLEFNTDLVSFIQEGSVDKVTYYSVEELGYTVIENASNYLDGETLPTFVEIEPFVVDISNVMDVEPEF